jgi:hypothetical protein
MHLINTRTVRTKKENTMKALILSSLVFFSLRAFSEETKLAKEPTKVGEVKDARNCTEFVQRVDLKAKEIEKGSDADKSEKKAAGR